MFLISINADDRRSAARVVDAARVADASMSHAVHEDFVAAVSM
jgi:hypothetical protein